VIADELLDAWPLDQPRRLRPTGSGINSLTHFVEAGAGGYLLKVYQATADLARLRYEHALLGALREAGLPFAVPAPLPSRAGDTIVRLPDGERLAALFELIPGQPPDRTNPTHARAIGRALGQLHRALAGIELGPPPDPERCYGALDRVHAQVPDPLAAPDELPIGGDERRRLRAILAELVDQVPNLYARLPRQLCHCDYGPGQTLIVGDRISGVLDFEFAGPDLRAIDVATGWYWTCSRSVDDRWPPIAAFAAGYRAVVKPTEAELAAAPTLARLQRAAGLVHWVGRLRAGQAEPGLVREQAERLLALDDFLEREGERLIGTLAGA
jgi:Ser/Thr protein kinase RdoA (MazF antagonist)